MRVAVCLAIFLSTTTITCLQVAGSLSDKPLPTVSRTWDDADAKELIRDAIGSAATGWAEREGLRAQLMGLTITVAIGIISLVFRRPETNRKIFFVLALFLLFMHVLDAFLQDLSERQINHRERLRKSLLTYDSMAEDQKLAAVETAFQGIEEKSLLRKVRVFWCPGLFQALWHWGLFAANIFVCLWAKNNWEWRTLDKFWAEFSAFQRR